MPKKVRDFQSKLLSSTAQLDSAIIKVEQAADSNMIRFAE